SKMHQANISYDNLRSRLTLGVREAVESSASNAERIVLAQKQIEDAREPYKLSKSRLDNSVPASSPSEVLLAPGTLAPAQASYRNPERDIAKHNTLLLLRTGIAPTSATENGPAPGGPARAILVIPSTSAPESAPKKLDIF